MLCFTRRIARSRPPHRQSVPILSFFCITALYRDMQLTAASPPVRCPSNCRHPLPDPCAATTSPDPCAAATSSDSRIAATLPRRVPQSRPRQQPPCAACVRRAPPRVVAALLRATSSSRAPPSGALRRGPHPSLAAALRPGRCFPASSTAAPSRMLVPGVVAAATPGRCSEEAMSTAVLSFSRCGYGRRSASIRPSICPVLGEYVFLLLPPIHITLR
jgi:hypothetical protein